VSVPAYAIVYGIAVGLPYGLLAMGLVLIYRTSRVLNFAHGQLGVMAAVLVAHLANDEHLPYVAAIAAGLGVAVLTGAGCELLLRRLRDRPRLLVMVATIGLAQVLFLLSLLPFVQPREAFEAYPLPAQPSFTMDRFVFSPGATLTLIVAPIVAIAFAAFFTFSRTGLRLRASAENPESARLAGVPVARMSTLAWVLAAVLSAITAILNAPDQGSSYVQALGPEVLVLALTAALIAGMSSMSVAFVAGIAIGVIREVLFVNVRTPTSVDVAMFGLIFLALLLRVGRLRGTVGADDRASWRLAVAPAVAARDPLRRAVGRSAVGVAVAVALVIPLFVDTGRDLLLARIAVFALIAVSLTVLAGWAGQLSLGHMAIVGVGAVLAARLSGDVPLVALLLVGGLVGAAVAAVIGIPALRIPGLYLAVTTLGLALVARKAVLDTPCTTLPVIHRRICTGLPDPQTTLVPRTTLFGWHLNSNQDMYYVTLAILLLVLIGAVAWRDRGIARVFLAVRGNEAAAAALGVRPMRVKLTAFAVSGFLAGVAGICYGFVLQRFPVDDFSADRSLLVVAMVVIGGLGSISGAVLGALYLVGLPAIFGSTQTVQFLTSGVGLLFFILYVPGGFGRIASGLADAVTLSLRRLTRRRGYVPSPVEAADLGEPVGAGR
jgi:ABC-type branched-subunit amino acid transport system permease subunit